MPVHPPNLLAEDEDSMHAGLFPKANLPLSLLLGVILVLQIISAPLAPAAAFTNSAINFPGLDFGSVAWGDYDADGRLDLLLTGSIGSDRITQLWRNTATGFVNANISLPPVSDGGAVWGDYDNDGRLDILLTGWTPSGVLAQVWRNTAYGFSNINANLPPFHLGTSAWADFDNDGKLDIVFTGTTSDGPSTQIWRNTGQDFVNMNAGLPGLFKSSLSDADFDKDGRVDILLAGDTGIDPLTQIWRNTGSGFTNLNAGLPGVSSGAVAWGDYDNDGRLDILLTGQGRTNLIAQVWRNTGAGFTLVSSPLTPLQWGAAVWGDYDNDGRLDIFLTGHPQTGMASEVWRNTGGSFQNIDAALTPVYLSSAAWGDFNTDGRLDIILAGYAGGTFTNFVTQLWVNTATATNHPPDCPAGLASEASQSGVRLYWTAASDSKTPSSGLTYNVRVGTSPGGGEIVSAHSASNGTRLLPSMGNCFERTFIVLTNLGQGTYYWSVQAIDSAFTGSAFAAEKFFVIGGPPIHITQPTVQSVVIRGSGPSGVSYTMQVSSNLVTWDDAASLTAGSNGVLCYTNIIGVSKQFYRLRQP